MQTILHRNSHGSRASKRMKRESRGASTQDISNIIVDRPEFCIELLKAVSQKQGVVSLLLQFLFCITSGRTVDKVKRYPYHRVIGKP